MRKVFSKDGTPIAFEQSGQGTPLILVVGAFNDHGTGAPLAESLQSRFTVFNYDRRGRGESGDTLPYAVEREIEDLEALINEAGGSAAVFGFSSGAALALKAAAQGLNITKLVLYEPPILLDQPVIEAEVRSSVGVLSTANGQVIELDHARTGMQANLAAELDALVSAGRRGDAVELFQTKAVGIPEEIVVQMRHSPYRPALEKIAHTLVYEMNILADMASPLEQVASLTTPTLTLVGGESPAFLINAAKTLAAGLPNGSYNILEGQNHDLVPAVLAPVITTFLVS